MPRPQPQRRDRVRTPELTGPIRTCLGCGIKAAKPTLIRVVAVAGELTIDAAGRLPGRGAYCCRNVDCFRQTVKQRKKLAWALRKQGQALDFVVSPELEVLFGRLVGPERITARG